ncbi:hypothetical protein [Streptomyces sp. UNOC14_S4]|uniref:hypothetical protein n=1 Tax=Streptomyces sp. UNOC14_S4 TaxID=2872340 RepID=UPI001E638853|nr:hypothetical protein [Streptomyces sp. UNOC14_S4]MCC3773043.1 hypothetical protein [Streptomyces sp. UNOC14_S4]
MPKLTSTATTPGTADGAVRVPPVPDLTGIDLRTLRRVADPGLAVAVEEVLGDPDGLEITWYSGGEDATGRNAPGRP